ncbi:uncharacterized protein LOC129617185 [Condylostylus longicornis]|uniref:uncharacterized protein LOC129617185 n=1 Tax=Condylostylus longicornis TaxID=2530218 RepID=UPI00244E4177|nr:uncharacterized protein LOC129617185 [Condylostylus longicornis]
MGRGKQGIHVTTAAANGYMDLDHPLFKGKYSRERDSGAIYAGAGDPWNGEKSDFSEWGSRVDLWSWGGGVTTTTWEAGKRGLYTHTYGGTGSANTIIAGCAAFIQVEQNFADHRNVGRQPDLVKAIQILETLSEDTSTPTPAPTSTTTTSTTTTTTSTTTTTTSTTTTTTSTTTTTTSTTTTTTSKTNRLGQQLQKTSRQRQAGKEDRTQKDESQARQSGISSIPVAIGAASGVAAL